MNEGWSQQVPHFTLIAVKDIQAEKPSNGLAWPLEWRRTESDESGARTSIRGLKPPHHWVWELWVSDWMGWAIVTVVLQGSSNLASWVLTSDLRRRSSSSNSTSLRMRLGWMFFARDVIVTGRKSLSLEQKSVGSGSVGQWSLAMTNSALWVNDHLEKCYGCNLPRLMTLGRRTIDPAWFSLSRVLSTPLIGTVYWAMIFASFYCVLPVPVFVAVVGCREHFGISSPSRGLRNRNKNLVFLFLHVCLLPLRFQVLSAPQTTMAWTMPSYPYTNVQYTPLTCKFTPRVRLWLVVLYVHKFL